ncbi:acetate--CoA ligase [Russula aff. rugulosa BPL654]|nr:acetate--CoA ligase [Russula aff. rugulosa BPL654]
MSEPVPLHPVAPRLKNGPKKPHVARETLYWDRPFTTVRTGSFEKGDIAWFPEGALNASYNCVDRWAFKHPDKTAIIYEADEPGTGRDISFAELLHEKGDTVSIYLPMTWQAVAAFLACARIGAVHSVVFAGFSAEALRDRINDCQSRIVLTADEGRRGGKTIATKAIVDSALTVARTSSTSLFSSAREIKFRGRKAVTSGGMRRQDGFPTSARLSLFHARRTLLNFLQTSGSTGKPKGVVHTTAGYLLGVALTHKYVFDIHPDDRYACMADVGWITGHSYIVYGPLANGTTTTVFESTPVYPTPSRYWQVVEQRKLTQFYSAPTAIRLLRRHGAQYVEPHDLSSLRIIGTVGEPINPEAWNWYNETVGRRQCAIVDTYWQTETGSIIVTPFPGAIETKPGSATVPFMGIDPVILDPQSGKILEGNNVEGVLAVQSPWPSIARTVFKDHDRYLATYMKPYPGVFYTGDGAARDEHGYIWIKGRVDDVINVSGHRMSTAEIESALILHPGVAEVAVIAASDDVTGQAVHAFVALKPEFKYDRNNEEALNKELALQVRKVIGPFAVPKKVYIVPDLPKTRSGKIMRRIMRKIVAGEGDQLGDLSTIAEPGCVDQIKAKVAQSG